MGICVLDCSEEILKFLHVENLEVYAGHWQRKYMCGRSQQHVFRGLTQCHHCKKCLVLLHQPMGLYIHVHNNDRFVIERSDCLHVYIHLMRDCRIKITPKIKLI